jgi:hypothetical protein
MTHTQIGDRGLLKSFTARDLTDRRERHVVNKYPQNYLLQYHLATQSRYCTAADFYLEDIEQTDCAALDVGRSGRSYRAFPDVVDLEHWSRAIDMYRS